MLKTQIFNNTSLEETLNKLQSTLLSKNAEHLLKEFKLQPTAKLLKSTLSLCPSCLDYSEAVVFSYLGKVFKKTKCATHGLSESIIENDENFYFLSNKDRWGRCFDWKNVFTIPQGDCCNGGSCTTEKQSAPLSPFYINQTQNKTCTVLVEVTNACNLSCRVCYSHAEGDKILPTHLFKEYLSELLKSKGTLDSIQLTGGEALLHPQFWDLLDWCYSLPSIKKIYLPTNGILLAQSQVIQKLIPYRHKMMVLLQFDSLRAEANQSIRQASPVALRLRVIAECAKAHIPMQLTMTITQDVNDDDIGSVIDAGIKHRNIKVVAFQPATYSGRYHLNPSPVNRTTLSDVIKAVQLQSNLKVKNSDFIPIPCSHPNCGWITLFIRKGFWIKNILPYVNLEQIINQVTNKTLLSTEELKSVVGTRHSGLTKKIMGWLGKKIIKSTDIFTLAIKPFMDRYTYDLDRISNCCHHTLDTKGKLVSFCEYNALHRPQDPWTHLDTIPV
ncbi:radical SAM protein [bacterium]|nr:radical SAM protein [bacterium]